MSLLDILKPKPEDAPYSYADLADPVRKALKFAYKMRRQNKGQDIPWDGPPIGELQAANCLDFAHNLSAEALEYAEEDQGRDALEEIIGVALRLGMEQGRRITLNSPEIQTLKLKLETARLMLGQKDEDS